jgi:phosphoglycolate phosphatase-like HAD superfamily hydrolase
MPYLVYDQPNPGAVDALERFQQAGVELIVMTMRRMRELDDAFNRYDLGRFFLQSNVTTLTTTTSRQVIPRTAVTNGTGTPRTTTYL